MTSDQIAIFALIVSIGGFWVSYKSWYQSRKLIAAEKRTQVWNTLVETRLELQDLNLSIREIRSVWESSGLSEGVATSPEAEEILNRHKALQKIIHAYENEIITVANVIQAGLERFKANSTDDPVVLEESQAMASEIKTRANRLVSNTSSLKVELENYSQRYCS